MILALGRTFSEKRSGKCFYLQWKISWENFGAFPAPWRHIDVCSRCSPAIKVIRRNGGHLDPRCLCHIDMRAQSKCDAEKTNWFCSSTPGKTRAQRCYSFQWNRRHLTCHPETSFWSDVYGGRANFRKPRPRPQSKRIYDCKYINNNSFLKWQVYQLKSFWAINTVERDIFYAAYVLSEALMTECVCHLTEFKKTLSFFHVTLQQVVQRVHIETTFSDLVNFHWAISYTVFFFRIVTGELEDASFPGLPFLVEFIAKYEDIWTFA